jgi:hypothetical protein
MSSDWERELEGGDHDRRTQGREPRVIACFSLTPTCAPSAAGTRQWEDDFIFVLFAHYVA